ncbi:TPA: hypothetical protein QCG56_001034 [Enterobacter cancerogenus]|nr:hypothetical protein [Enterobacter cancerogenus]HDR2163657.1 hypothetical protein [Enterobacter cancerogenus]HDR2266795.1 hypothetical protein [Enterobacter cancerogenus]
MREKTRLVRIFLWALGSGIIVKNADRCVERYRHFIAIAISGNKKATRLSGLII